jgi:hypothetical protein
LNCKQEIYSTALGQLERQVSTSSNLMWLGFC